MKGAAESRDEILGSTGLGIGSSKPETVLVVKRLNTTLNHISS
jgi:hypothetical protein